MKTKMKRLFVCLLATQIGLAFCEAVEFSWEDFLEGLRLAQVEITSGELKIIHKLDALPSKSQEAASAEAEAVIQQMEQQFLTLPPDVQKHPRHRTMHERNIRLSRKYLPQMIAGEIHVHEEWNLAFEVAYFSAKTKEPIFAHRLVQKDKRKYTDTEEAEFYVGGYTRSVIFDGIHALVLPEASPNVISSPETPPAGSPESFNYEIRQLIGRCIETNLRKQDIETFAPIKDGQSEYLLAFRIGKEKQILKKAIIDVEKSFCVKRIEYFITPDAQQPYSVVEFLEYRRSKAGIWYPQKIKRVGYRIKGTTRQISSIEEWDIAEVRFNVSFPDDFFQIPEKLRQFIQ
ncbi:TPA: hypothetical protein EYP66_13375 [Candidatus Poribacteria bacterium]|nr:hypothetical protein [Candidatus Poribacteria bacterium]